jgi:hypothetical protein
MRTEAVEAMSRIVRQRDSQSVDDDAASDKSVAYGFDGRPSVVRAIARNVDGLTIGLQGGGLEQLRGQKDSRRYRSSRFAALLRVYRSPGRSFAKQFGEKPSR